MSHIPKLPHHCNSWVVVRKADGQVIGEFWNRANVERFHPEKVRVMPTCDYLTSLNK